MNLNQKLNSFFSKMIEVFIGNPLKLLPLKNTIVFDSHPDFSDNSKVLFDKMLEQKINKKFKIIWLVEQHEKFINSKYENVVFVSKKRDTLFEKIKSEIINTFLITRSKYYIFSHACLARTKPKASQMFLNLTHGMSLKDTRGKQTIDMEKISYNIVTSEFSSELRAQSYNSVIDKNKILGFPRNDLLFSDILNLKDLNINKKDYNKIVIWMPTFRRQRNSQRNDSKANGNSDLPILDDNNIKELTSVLSKEKILLLIKPHPAQNMKYFDIINNKYIKLITNKELNDKKIDLYSLLSKCDALITDYSSVYIDYLNLNRPIGFTVDDLNNYSKGLGFLVKNPLDYMPGMKINSMNDLISFINSLSAKEDAYYQERLIMRRKFNKYNDNKSSSRIIDFMGF